MFLGGTETEHWLEIGSNIPSQTFTLTFTDTLSRLSKVN